MLRNRGTNISSHHSCTSQHSRQGIKMRVIYEESHFHDIHHSGLCEEAATLME